MKTQSYNKEIKIATSQFIDIFNNIIINRYSNNIIEEQIKVPCVYGDRSRILKSEENISSTVKLPIICVTIKRILRDTKRVHSVNNGLMFQVDDYNIAHNTAMPVNIVFELGILTKFQEDIDQIISNFVVNFNPAVYTVWQHPYEGLGTLKTQAIWNNDLDITYPEDIGEEAPYRISADTSFTYKTWMFPGTGEELPVKQILKINLCNKEGNKAMNKWFSVPNSMEFFDYEQNVRDGLVTEENYDHLQILDTITSGYWTDVYAVLSGSLLNPKLSGDLLTIINNYNNPNLFLTPVFIQNMPNHLQDVDYYSIFQRMLSGDMIDCFPLNGTDSKVVEVLKCTKCYNPNLRPTYFFTSNDIEYDNTYWATVGKVAWRSDCLWEGSTQIIPTSTSYDIIDATPQLIYNDTSTIWQFDPFGNSSILYNGPTTSNPIGIYTRGDSNILLASDEIYNFIIALTEDSQYVSHEDSILKLTEDSTYELISSYYLFTNGAYTYNDMNYLIVGEVQRQDSNTWTGVVSAIPEFASNPILQPTVNISHDEYYNWVISTNLPNFDTNTKTRYFGNPHPNGVYNNLNGQIIVDRDLSKYITNFYIMDDGSIWVFDENENFEVHGT